MADINITCQACGSVTTVSEFVDAAHLKCQSCGAQLEKPGGLETAVKQSASAEPTKRQMARSGLRLAKDRHKDGEPEEDGSSLSDIIKPPESEGEVKLHPKQKVKSGINHALLAGLLFVVLGAGAWYLRYGNILPDDILTYSAKYSWIVVLAINFMIVLKAMTDSMLQGILCLFIPGYSLYYLFVVTDEFYLRALIAALLIGIGQDAALELKNHGNAIFQSVTHFMETGGGEIR